MNKKQLLLEIRERANITNVESEAFLKAFVTTVKEALAKKEEVKLDKFGAFKTNQRKAFSTTLPGKSKKIKVPARSVPVFRPFTELKNLVK